MVLSHQENFFLRWIWLWRFIFFPLSILLLAKFGHCIARLCWFLSSCNQAKRHMSKFMFSSSLKRSSLFSIMTGKEYCWILILAYEVFATKCFYHSVLLSKCYCHFQLDSRYVLLVPRIFHILNKFNKGNSNATGKKKIVKAN